MSHVNADNPKFTPACGRTPEGTFAPGNPGGPGNPYARKVAFLRKSLNECISAAQVKLVVDAMFNLALAGNVQAARLFLQYAVGKPQEASNPDRVEIDEFQLRKESIVPEKDIETQIKSTPLSVTNHLVSVNDCLTAHRFERDWFSVLDDAAAAHKQSARQQTAETADPRRQQTAETAQAPVGQVADLPKAPESITARTSRPTTNRQQTGKSAQTHRQQTGESAPREAAPTSSDPKQSARVQIA